VGAVSQSEAQRAVEALPQFQSNIKTTGRITKAKQGARRPRVREKVGLKITASSTVQSARDRQMVSRFGYSRLTCLLQSNLLGWRDSVFCLRPLCRTPTLDSQPRPGRVLAPLPSSTDQKCRNGFYFHVRSPNDIFLFSYASLPPRPPQPGQAEAAHG
jgi:hypothetical protein